MTGYIPHRPSARQAEFLALECKEALYGGAAGGGKSDALLMAALQGVHVPGYAALLLRRTYADLSLPGALMDRAHDWLAGTGAAWNERLKTWTFPTSGATISFGYLETRRDRYRYQGAELQFIGFDEVTQFNEPDYRYLFSRLRAKAYIRIPLRMRAATNPGGIGHRWVQHRFGIPDEGVAVTHTHQGRVFVPSLMADNPGLDHAQYRKSLEELDSVTRAQLEDGRWVLDVSGLVYRYDPARHSVAELPPLPMGERWHYTLGVDYGLRDETAWAVVAWAEHESCAYIVWADKEVGMSPSEAAERTRDIIAAWQPELIVGDAGGLGAGYIDEARKRYALPIRAAEKTDKRGAIALFVGALESGQLRVVRSGAEKWEIEVSGLLWKDEARTKELDACPNHCADAALYAWRETRAYLASPREAPKGPNHDPHEAWLLQQAAAKRSRGRLLGAGFGR